ncbi:MAG: metallophosphoesterase family protein [Solirubrobacteraceae bacterium]
METTMPDTETVLSWVHFGDLHITRAGEQNYRDFLALIDKANRYFAERVSFALLPGDNADDGAEAQFRLVRDAIDNLSIPLHILPGDHDFHTRSLAPFYKILGADRLPNSVAVGRHRCLFLDIVSAGAGGPDFRLDDAQLDWMTSELEQAEKAGQRALVFMHVYPAPIFASAPSGFGPYSSAIGSSAWTWATPITTRSPTTPGRSFWPRARPARSRKVPSATRLLPLMRAS